MSQHYVDPDVRAGANKAARQVEPVPDAGKVISELSELVDFVLSQYGPTVESGWIPADLLHDAVLSIEAENVEIVRAVSAGIEEVDNFARRELLRRLAMDMSLVAERAKRLGGEESLAAVAGVVRQGEMEQTARMLAKRAGEPASQGEAAPSRGPQRRSLRRAVSDAAALFDLAGGVGGRVRLEPQSFTATLEKRLSEAEQRLASESEN